jgi:hypothetical protein
MSKKIYSSFWHYLLSIDDKRAAARVAQTQDAEALFYLWKGLIHKDVGMASLV